MKFAPPCQTPGLQLRGRNIVDTLPFSRSESLDNYTSFHPFLGQPSPASIYFSVLLEHGKLNALESVELLRPVVAQGRNELIKKWTDDGKLTESEELADLVRQIDQSIAFRIYTRIPNHMKAMLCLIEAGKVSKVVPYMKKVAETATVSYTTSSCGDKVAVVEGLPSVFTLVENVISSQPKDLVTFLSELIAGLSKDDVLCDVSKVTELLIRHNKLQELATVLLDYLKPNLPQHSALQTRLLEICLQNEPKIAATIMQLDVLTHFDKPYIARLCEDCGLYDIALQCYNKLADFQRVISKSGGEVSQGVLENALTSLGPEDAYEILRYMLVTTKSLDYVVSLSLSLHKKIGALKLANMFESVGSTGALFSYLRSLPVISKGVTEVTEENSQLVYKFIECAIAQGETVDLERVCKDSNCYDLVRVKDLLKHSHLSDPKSLMIVCNRLGAVGELTEYLYQNGFDKFIEVYVNTINPSGVSSVISTLFDLGAPDDVIFSILSDLRDIGGIKAMIKVAEERHQLVLMQSWLEARVSEGFNEPEIHTALAKIYISTQNNAEAFLRSNRFYDREVVGLFCENCDPQLAFLIYSESENDEKLSKLCVKNAMYKQLASYAFKRQSLDFWCKIFKEVEDPSRITDEVISMAAECTSTSSISCVIKAFMECGMNEQLIAILEKLLLSQADFSSNPNLQNLLLATTIKTNPEKLELYLTKLENYEVNPLAKMSNELGLHRCTFLIYSHSKRYLDALNALLRINLDEAKEYVSKLNMPELWFRLGRAYLDERMLKEAIEAYLKSGNLSDHVLIRRECKDDELFLNWLREARKIKSTRDVDADLLVCLAKAGESDEFSKILNGKHSADLNVVGDTLMELGLYKEAVKLYSTIPNHAKLAICYINMDKYSEASDSALKSRNPKVLKNVLDVCLDKSKLEMANKVALDLLTFPEFLPGLIACYEKLGFIDDLIKLLESSTKSVALSTELAVLLAKYRPEKLMNYLEETFAGKITSACLNVGKVARECCNLWLWKEAVYLYSINDLDKALLSMIVHAPLAWDPDVFFTCLKNVTNTEVIYRSLHFLIQQKPLLIEELFRAIRIKLDMSRLIKIMRNANCLALAREYLERADRVAAVNDALFEIYVEENQWDLLEKEVGKYDDFDHQKLCKLLEVHHLPQMRAIGAKIYCKQRNFSKAALIYNKNENHSAAIDAARSSRNELVVIDLLNKFIAADLMEEFVACLVVNYTLVNPADVLELAWLSNVDKDAIMPFLIQTLRTLHSNNGFITRDKYPQISYR